MLNKTPEELVAYFNRQSKFRTVWQDITRHFITKNSYKGVSYSEPEPAVLTNFESYNVIFGKNIILKGPKKEYKCVVDCLDYRSINELKHIYLKKERYSKKEALVWFKNNFIVLPRMEGNKDKDYTRYKRYLESNNDSLFIVGDTYNKDTNEMSLLLSNNEEVFYVLDPATFDDFDVEDVYQQMLFLNSNEGLDSAMEFLKSHSKKTWTVTARKGD
jgi:hypothetical protein